IFYAPIGLLLNFLEFLLLSDFSMLPLYGLCFGLTSIFAIILFYAGAYGGADAKALMCLALALPFYPQSLTSVFSVDISPTMQLFFPLAVFSNSVLFAALTAIYMLFHNLLWRWRAGKSLFEGEQQQASIWRKILVLLTSYKLPIEKLEAKWHIYPMEDVEEAEKTVIRKLIVFPKDSERDVIVKRLADAIKRGLIPNQVWATPGLPMLIFITLGLIVALVFGDVVWILVRFLLG
ncbi:hypothetical protein H5T51_02935, partial [Candidatus Bathyarchaeota archaeon]|nr:hypothetical protein [Candidatus Bathyarchaeota archaeon]